MMTGLVLAFLLHGAAETGSLGIGLDVLAEAFSFAAKGVGYHPELRLAHCGSQTCRWSLGEGVEMTAALSADSLSVSRIEAGLETGNAASPTAVAQYRKACRTIVALVDAQAPTSEQVSITGSIAGTQTPPVELRLSEGGRNFYGVRGSGSGSTHCGVTASAADAGPQP